MSHTKKSGAKLWARACSEAGVESQTLHATRHTFITLARRGGARTEVVERITHNSSGTIVDHYTHWDWEPLCEAVLAIRLPAPVAKNVAVLAKRPVFSERIRWTRLQPIRTASELELEFAVFTSEPFQFHRIAEEARTMRRLGMSLRAIGAALGVDEKTVRKALGGRVC